MLKKILEVPKKYVALIITVLRWQTNYQVT